MIHGDTLRSLAAHRGWPLITLYLHTHRTTAEKDQDRIRLKNLLRDVCDDLAATGMPRTETAALCEPARSLLDRDEFWRETSEGLAIFVAEDLTEIMKLDTPVPELGLAGDRFGLRPLLVARHQERDFFALALSKNGCRLFRGDGESIEQVALEDVPASLADETKYDQREESLQFSTVPGPQAVAGTGRAQGMFHGHGGEKDVEKTDLERYLRKVERAVAKQIAHEESVPLVLMGVEYAIATYRALDTSRAVAGQVTGATEELAPHQIHAAALAELAPHFAGRVDSVLAELAAKEGTGLVETGIERIAQAALGGRVRTLLVGEGLGPFGVVDRNTSGVRVVTVDTPRCLRAEPLPEIADECGWDLVDLAAAETILHGGDVIAVGPDRAIDGAIALLRY